MEMPSKRLRLEVRRSYPAEDWDKISLGIIPVVMENKWFIYADGMCLHLHRSWTGFEIFMATFEIEGNELKLVDAWVNLDREQYESKDTEHEKECIYKLIDNMREDREEETDEGFCSPIKSQSAPEGVRKFVRIAYNELSSRQQESYNFQKVSALLADYGFTTIRLTDDWQGADFIAQHIKGEFLKVQLKGRLSFYKKYQDKDLYICFRVNESWFFYPHDDVLKRALEIHAFGESKSWIVDGGYSFPSIPKELMPLLDAYRIS